MQNPRIYYIKRILNMEGYKFYKKKFNIDKSLKAESLNEWKTIQKAIWAEIRDSIVKSDGGLYIKKIGYFALFMETTQRRLRRRRSKVPMYNDHSDNRGYHMTLFTNLVKNTKLRHWGLDRGFQKRIRFEVYKQILGGKRYQLKYTILKKLYLNRETSNREQVFKKNANTKFNSGN